VEGAGKENVTPQFCETSRISCLYYKAADKWVLGGAEAPPNFWHEGYST